jgi:hypothetical protein
MTVKYKKKNPDGTYQTATYLIQPNPIGGVTITSITGTASHQRNALDDADAIGQLDMFYPQPPWSKSTHET